MRRFVSFVLAVSLLAGCDALGGPRGPGTLTARIRARGAEVGAAVLRVSGAGVKGFSPAGTSRIYGRPGARSGTSRLVVVNPHPGDLSFRIRVEDVAAPPSVEVMSAADGADRLLPAGADVRVSVER